MLPFFSIAFARPSRQKAKSYSEVITESGLDEPICSGNPLCLGHVNTSEVLHTSPRQRLHSCPHAAHDPAPSTVSITAKKVVQFGPTSPLRSMMKGIFSSSMQSQVLAQ